jgi:hypothetical protein
MHTMRKIPIVSIEATIEGDNSWKSTHGLIFSPHLGLATSFEVATFPYLVFNIELHCAIFSLQG